MHERITKMLLLNVPFILLLKWRARFWYILHCIGLNGTDDLCLWPFAMKHAAWLLYNHVPCDDCGFTPIELLPKTKFDHKDLLCSHVWGCPMYVLDHTLQDGKKLPKWNRCARLGQFLGFSEAHSPLVVANIRNLTTGFVSPQYHVVID